MIGGIIDAPDHHPGQFDFKLIPRHAVLSPEAYDGLADKAELAESLTMIERSMGDIREGILNQQN